MKKFLKRAGIVLLVLVVILVVVALLMPRTVHIENKTVIKAPRENVYEMLANFRNWDRWSVWNQMDPNWKVEYTGPQEGLNASYNWASENRNVGNGKATTVLCAPFDSLKVALEFMGQGNPAYVTYALKPSDGGTEVTTSFDADMGWNLVARLFAPMIKGEVDKNTKLGMESVRKICEENPKNAANGKYEIMMSAENGGPYYSVRDTCSTATIGARYAQYYGMIGQAMKKAGLKQQAPAFAITHSYNRDSGTFEIEWCIPTDKAGPGDGMVKPGTLKSGKTVRAEYYGAYEKMDGVYSSMAAYMKDKNLTPDGPPMEIYITAPTGPDMSQVLTIVEYYVK